MRNFKKFLTLVLAVMMVVSAMSFSTSAARTVFEDVDTENEVLVDAVDLLSYMEITKGKDGTTFGAAEDVTREQFALFMYRLMKGGKDAPNDYPNTTSFKDLDDPTYNYAISWANAVGIVKGKSEEVYGPKDSITLQEAYAMVVRALGYEDAEALAYPYEHITLAERKGIELDTGLDSDIDYEEKLTRADMAIILYNAFFAETAEPEIYTVERGIGYVEGYDRVTGEPLYSDYVLEECIEYPRLCEKAFGVYEATYQVVATPNYEYAGMVNEDDLDGYYDFEATYDIGYEAAQVMLTYTTSNARIREYVPGIAYLEPEQLGLESGELDAWFLGHFTTFVTIVDEKADDKEIEKVLFADCDMVKKTVTDIELSVVSSNKADSYYVDENNAKVDEDGNPEIEINEEGDPVVDYKRGDKLLSGEIVAGEEKIYVYNAPYNYTKVSYEAEHSDALSRYLERNSDNLKGIGLLMNEADGGDINYYTALSYPLVTPISYTDEDAEVVKDGFFTQQAIDLLNGYTVVDDDDKMAEVGFAGFEQVYYDGLYEAELIDCDGDDRYEFINYKPYSLFQVDADEEKHFVDDNDFDEIAENIVDEIPYIYTNGATVTGASFDNEDYVIGYYSEELEVVKVVEVIKPTIAKIKNIKFNTGKLVLGDGTNVDAVSGWKYVANKFPMGPVINGDLEFELDVNGDNVYDVYSGIVFDEDAQVAYEVAAGDLFDEDFIGEEVELYIYNGVVLHNKPVDKNLKFTENLVIPTTFEGEKPVRWVFDKDLGTDVYYIYAWIDGAERYIPVDYEDVLPEIINPEDDEDLTFDYEDQLCVYTLTDGVYSIKSLGYDINDDYDEDEDEAPEYLGVIKGTEVELKEETVDAVEYTLEGDDENAQYFVPRQEGLGLKKVAGSRFQFVDADGNKVKDFATDVEDETVELDFKLDFKAYTKIVVRQEVDDDEYEFVELDAADFTKSMEGVFDTVTFIVSNNPESESRENLVVLYATTTEFEFKGTVDKTAYRIVSNNEVEQDEEGDWRVLYDLYNPITGKKDEAVPGKATAKKANGLDNRLEIGALINLVDGIVDDKTMDDETDDFKYKVADMDTANLVWITEYDEAEGWISVVPAESTDDVEAPVANGCKDCFDEQLEAYEGYYYDIEGALVDEELNENEGNYITIDDSTVITVMEGDKNNMFQWGSIALANKSVLADPSEDYLCYNTDNTDRNGNFKTGYADYLKAYVALDYRVDDDENPVAEFIILVVHDDEEAALNNNNDCGDDDH